MIDDKIFELINDLRGRGISTTEILAWVIFNGQEKNKIEIIEILKRLDTFHQDYEKSKTGN